MFSGSHKSQQDHAGDFTGHADGLDRFSGRAGHR